MLIPKALTSMGVFLMKKKTEDDQYSKLIDITNFGDLGGTPELLDASTLSHSVSVSVLGMQQQDSIAFEANYTKAEYASVQADAYKEMDLAVWIGGEESGDGTMTPTGANGKFPFKGMYSIMVNGAGVNEVLKCTITVAALTAPQLDTSDT
ncbi:MAG: phage tail protein [Candidatus Cryptobacteroides sp.]